MSVSTPSEPIEQSGPADLNMPSPAKRRLPWAFLLAGLLLTGLAVGVGRLLWRAAPEPKLAVSGRLEGYETDVGTKVSGRIERMTVREGDRVTQGQVIAQLDDAELKAELAAAGAQVATAQQQVKQAQLQLAVVDSQIAELELTRSQSTAEASGRIQAAAATVATAQAQLAQAQAQLKQVEAELRLAQADRDRFAQLLADGAVSQQRFEQARTQFETVQETLAARKSGLVAAQQQVDAAQGSLTQASSSTLNPEIRTAQIQRLQTQRVQATAQLEAAQSEVTRAQANRQALAARLSNLKIVSPIDGIVLTRTSEPGEVIAAGTPVLTVIDLGQIYLRGYLPEGDIGKVRVGQKAQVFLDSAPQKALAATVSAIDAEASFTPENIYFQDDRVTQVFGLKLSLTRPQGFAKPGMPADGEIILDNPVP